ncbi:hypothetical protein Tco_0781546 [Tanacetum coccineum]
MGKPLSPDRVFDFPIDEREPHPAYDFFAPGPLPGYAGNPNNNNNGWIKADEYLLGELEAMADEPMIDPIIDEVAEPVAEAKVEQVIAPVVNMDEDIDMLFGNDEFEDDASEGFDEDEPLSVYEVGGPSTAAAEGLSFPLPAPGLPIPSSVIEYLSPGLGNLEYGHGQLVKKVIQVMASQMVHAADRWEQVGAQADVQQRDSQIQQLQTTVTEMSSRESTLMHCILGMDRRLEDLERRPPGPFLRWVEAEWLVSRLKMRNGEDSYCIGSMLPLMYQLMAVKKTSFPEIEYSGSVVTSIPDVVEDQNKALSDT